MILIEDEEKKITEKFELKELALNDAIVLLRTRPDDPISISELHELTQKLEQLRLRHELRQEAITKWKNDVRNVLTEKSEREAQDAIAGEGMDRILERISKLMRECSIDPEE